MPGAEAMAELLAITIARDNTAVIGMLKPTFRTSRFDYPRISGDPPAERRGAQSRPATMGRGVLHRQPARGASMQTSPSGAGAIAWLWRDYRGRARRGNVQFARSEQDSVS